jgi:apolipoprotein N-acyltransferase
MNKKYILLSLLSGLLLAFSFPNFLEQGLKTHTFFFIWFAYAPLFYIFLKENSLKYIFIYSTLTALEFYLISLYWLCNVKPMGYGAYACWALLCVYCTFSISLPLILSKLLKSKSGVDYLLSVPVLLTIFEFSREWMLTGFPILTPAQSQYQLLPFLQILKYTGIYGPNFLIFFINVLAAMLFAGQKPDIKKTGNAGAICIAGLLLLLVIPANSRIIAGKTIKAGIIQPNIDQGVEWSKEYKEQSLNTIRGMIKNLKNDKPDIIVWPETGYPGILKAEPWKALEIAGWAPGAYNIVGSDNVAYNKKEPEYYNTAFFIGPGGAIEGEYSKMHLVPFGEYIPLQNIVPFIHQAVRRYGFVGYTAGNSAGPMEMNGLKFGILICYDGVFPEISRKFAEQGAAFMVHLSYETWYGRTPASSQIFVNTALRAIENEIPIIRCVASGISGFVTSRGEIYSETGLFEKKAVTAAVVTGGKRTVYARFGGWFIYFLALILAGIFLLGIAKKNDITDHGH